jgi:hypothetical protein
MRERERVQIHKNKKSISEKEREREREYRCMKTSGVSARMKTVRGVYARMVPPGRAIPT